MLICENCGRIFDDTELDYKHTEEYGRISVCPYCGSEEISGAKTCNCCGLWVTDEEFEEGLCTSCASKTMKLFRELLIRNFSDEQIDFLSHTDCF